jgi:hypothetical protein
MGFIDSFKLGWDVMMVDKGTQGTDPSQTVHHAMAGDGQTCKDAKIAADKYVADKGNRLVDRLHAAQDRAASWHYGVSWNGHISLNHILQDVFYGDAVGEDALKQSIAILRER